MVWFRSMPAICCAVLWRWQPTIEIRRLSDDNKCSHNVFTLPLFASVLCAIQLSLSVSTRTGPEWKMDHFDSTAYKATHKRFLFNHIHTHTHTNCNAVWPIRFVLAVRHIKISVIFYANDDESPFYLLLLRTIWITDALFIPKYAIHLEYLHLIFPNTINHFIYFTITINMPSEFLFFRWIFNFHLIISIDIGTENAWIGLYILWFDEGEKVFEFSWKLRIHNFKQVVLSSSKQRANMYFSLEFKANFD